MVLALITACSAPCPPGFAPDPARVGRIRQLVDAPSAPTCFGERPDLGVLRDGRLLLDARASDPALAARSVHLAHHLGQAPVDEPDCLSQLRSEEARAWLAENELRASFGLQPLWPLGLAPSVDEVEAWLDSDQPGAQPLASSHARRCGG